MKTLFNAIALLAVVVAASFQTIPFANAQYNRPYPPMVLCNGGYIPQGTPCGGSGGLSMVGVPGHPGMFRSGGNVYRCSATATWAGRLAGAAAGFLIGKNIRFEGSQMGPLGTVIGVVAGQEIACELAAENVVHPGYQRAGETISSIVTPQEKRYCKPETQWRRLNWEGHPQHGKFICLPDGDSHRFEGE